MTAPTPRTPVVIYETKVVKLIVQDRRDRKKYEQLLSDGRVIESIDPHVFFRGAQYVLRREKIPTKIPKTFKELFFMS